MPPPGITERSWHWIDVDGDPTPWEWIPDQGFWVGGGRVIMPAAAAEAGYRYMGVAVPPSLVSAMSEDGVALISVSHPIAPLWRRWLMWLRPERISRSTEVVEIEMVDRLIRQAKAPDIAEAGR